MTRQELHELVLEIRGPLPFIKFPREIYDEILRRGVLRPDGRPYSRSYLKMMTYWSREKEGAVVALRAERKRVARTRGRHSRREWLDMIAVFGGRCVRCRRKADPITKDHIRPLCCEEDSSDAIENIQPLCRPCNSSGDYYMDYREKAKTVWTPAKIRALRADLGETVEQFAERFGRSGRTVEDWEQGRRRPDVMVLLSMQRISSKRRKK